MPETPIGYIEVIPGADLLAPVNKCECKWGANDCPNLPHMVIVCRDVKGFTVGCKPHIVGFAEHVDPCDGSYVYMTLDQFDRCRTHGLYTKYLTYNEYWKAVRSSLMSLKTAFELGIFPKEPADG